MKAEEFLSDDFLKQFKTDKQLNDFLVSSRKELFKRCWKVSWSDIWVMGRRSDSKNTRNGYGKRRSGTVTGNPRLKYRVIGTQF
jgi:putative transposase